MRNLFKAATLALLTTLGACGEKPLRFDDKEAVIAFDNFIKTGKDTTIQAIDQYGCLRNINLEADQTDKYAWGVIPYNNGEDEPFPHRVLIVPESATSIAENPQNILINSK